MAPGYSPCPFCGGEPAITLGVRGTVKTVDVVCQDCWATMPCHFEEDAIKDWNTRDVAQAGQALSRDDLASLLANAIFSENLTEMPVKREEFGPSWCQDDMRAAAKEILSSGYVVTKTCPTCPMTSTHEKSHG